MTGRHRDVTDTPRRILTIVCATDLSPGSLPAVRWAARLAAPLHARVVLSHVLPPAAELVLPPAMPAPLVASIDPMGAVEVARRRAHDDLLRTAESELGPAIEWELCVAEGPTAVELRRIAHDKRADLLVIGTHGRGGLARVVLGSVADAVVKKAPCAVVTVRSDD